MQVKVDLKIFLFALLFLLTQQIEVYVTLMIYAFLHECGHLLSGILLGFRPKEITFTPFGLRIGFSLYCGDYNKKIGKGNLLTVKKIILAIAGPLTNFILIGILLILPIEEKEIAIYANLLIGLFNLLPIYPLDGGRILKNAIHLLEGLEISYDYTNKIANISIIILTALSSIGILYLKNIAILIIIIYLWFIVVKENKRYEIKKKIYESYKSS